MILTPNFLPCIAFWQEIFKDKEIKIKDDDIYYKQSYRNRTQILTANKVLNLIIPVHASSGKTLTKDVKIDKHEDWQRIHLQSIKAAYNRSPYYQYYDYIFQILYEKKYDFLLDVIIDSLTLCQKAMGINLPISLLKEEKSETLNLNSKNQNEIIDNYTFKPYLQTFGNTFVPNLSILDLIFCCGPEAKSFLNKSTGI